MAVPFQKGPKTFLMKKKKNCGCGALVRLFPVGRTYYFFRVYPCRNRDILLYFSWLTSESIAIVQDQLAYPSDLSRVSRQIKDPLSASEVKPEL